MAPFYKLVCEQLKWTLDAPLLASMEAANAAELAKLDEKIEECEKNEGESEVPRPPPSPAARRPPETPPPPPPPPPPTRRSSPPQIREAFLARTEFYMRIGEAAKTHAAIEETYGKTVAMGLRLDLLLSKLRVGFFHHDLPLVKATIERAKALLEQGGDWERRNRLKVYEAVFLLMVRDFKKASALFLDAVATFTATELLSYNHFIMYAVTTSLIALPRAQLKAKVVDTPEILQVIDEIPHLRGLMTGLYKCNYRTLMQSLVDMVDALKADRAFSPHARYYYREMRVLAYTQFLEAYRSVPLHSMAATFGVSPSFLDVELSSFISSGRLSCCIDKVGGVVNSTRPDTKNAQYQATIKQGDVLLNRVQKLSRVINL